MPDPNKFKALANAGFRVRATCYRCESFDRGAGGWGTCRSITYSHQKHTGTRRQASVPADGWCPKYKMEARSGALLGAHSRFVEDS